MTVEQELAKEVGSALLNYSNGGAIEALDGIVEKLDDYIETAESAPVVLSDPEVGVRVSLSAAWNGSQDPDSAAGSIGIDVHLFDVESEGGFNSFGFNVLGLPDGATFSANMVSEQMSTRRLKVNGSITKNGLFRVGAWGLPGTQEIKEDGWICRFVARDLPRGEYTISLANLFITDSLREVSAGRNTHYHLEYFPNLPTITVTV